MEPPSYSSAVLIFQWKLYCDTNQMNDIQTIHHHLNFNESAKLFRKLIFKDQILNIY